MSQPWQRNRELNHLHPIFREKVNELSQKLSLEGIPFWLFEGFRSPQRQQYLYAQGRTRPGNIVTYAKPWTSYHQYGLATDFVLYENGSWSWDTSGEKARWWERLHELGREQGMEPLSWEKPHLQLPGLDIATLRAGHYPPDGDEAWAENLEASIYSWSDLPPSPPVPDLLPERPALEVEPLRIPERVRTRSARTVDWHNCFGGREWRYDEHGVYLHDHADGQEALRTSGKPRTCRKMWSLFAEELVAASEQYDLSVALIMMVVATETAFLREFGFTGPRTFRWEPDVKVKDVSPPIWGDYSAGPMQTLATTVRWIIRQQSLDHDPFRVAPVFKHRPQPPEELPLYDPAISIDIGTAVIKQNLEKTGDDPILVAAAYNAGGLRKSKQNPWHLKTTGDHLDRAARWYGDACAVLKELQS
jgi:peptidoglycan L-alanyl-D-glutamate endopeptidase CwlK